MVKQKGFTLLEVLLALLVMGIGLAALVSAGQNSADALSKLTQKSDAFHVADQVMMQLYQRSGLQTGQHQGSQKFHSQDWYWRADVQSTDNPRIARIDLKVGMGRDFEFAEAQLFGFKSQ